MDLHALATYRATVEPTLRKRLQNALVAAEDALIRRCARKAARDPADEEDLMQAGRIGVMRAIDKFDPTRGAWTQFAKQWIRHEFTYGVILKRPIARVTGWRSKKMPRDVRKAAHRIEATTGKAATAQELGVSEEDLETWNKKAVVAEYSEVEVGSGGSGPRSRVLDTSAVVAAASTPSQTILTDSFWRALASLAPQEARVLLAIVVDERQVKEVAQAEGHEERWGTATYRRALAKMREAMVVRP